MLRYLKVNNEWIDTLEQCKIGYYYFVIDGKISYLSDETMTEHEIGTLEDEKDVL